MRINLCACILYPAFCSCLLYTGNAAARKTVAFLAEGGAAAGYISSQGTDVKFLPRILPHLGVTLEILLEGRLSLNTGVIYEQKGWRSRSASLPDSDGHHYESSAAIKLQEIVIPLQLCYTIGTAPALQWRVAGGMSYGFLLSGEGGGAFSEYRGTALLNTRDFTYEPVISFIPDDSRLKQVPEGTAYYRFNVALRGHAGLTWRGRYEVTGFWEYNLYDISPHYYDQASLHIGYCGISLGLRL